MAHEAELKTLPALVDAQSARGTLITVGQNPKAMAESPDGKRLYVTNNTDNTISVSSGDVLLTSFVKNLLKDLSV